MNAINTTVTIDQIAVAKLVPSKDNVRRTNRGERIEELAASIAAHGLLQNLTVRPVENGKYEVIAGGRRLAAMKLLVKQKRMAKDATVPCMVVAQGNVTEISLAENALQCAMHPADQYEAFAELHRQGQTVEDIAARFGVSPTVVTQRLKLGAVSPKLMKVYRAGDMNLEQLSAFCITDDHTLQERVWKGLGYNRNRRAILEALSEGQVRMDDRRALFVGAEAYAAAGGTMVRDLFDEDGGGYFTDVALLTRLVEEKLAAEAGKVGAEGWAWVEAMPALDHGAVSGMRRVYPVERQYTEEEQARLDDLSTRYEELHDALEEDESEETEAALAEIEAQVEAIRGEDAYAETDKPIAGAIVTIGHDGALRIERGFVRREDDPVRAASADRKKAEGNGDAPKPALPDSLILELTAHRTAALANELAQRPDLALAAVTHALALHLLYVAGGRHSCLTFTALPSSPGRRIGGFDESPAGRAVAERQAAWLERLPENPEDLWAFVAALPNEDMLALLAHCAALTLDAVHGARTFGKDEAVAHAGVLAAALGLDMTRYWHPTAGFFARVSKAEMLKAVREGVSPEAAQTCEGLKKQPMAERTAKLLAGKGWLPEVLR